MTRKLWEACTNIHIFPHTLREGTAGHCGNITVQVGITNDEKNDLIPTSLQITKLGPLCTQTDKYERLLA